MPAWGGKTPLFGTNPIAALFPRRDAEPLVIDLALSEAARGKIMLAAKEDEPISPGWAVDKNGQPTTDAKAALEGSMLPAGGAKGAMLALIVELLVCEQKVLHLVFENAVGKKPFPNKQYVVLSPARCAKRF